MNLLRYHIGHGTLDIGHETYWQKGTNDLIDSWKLEQKLLVPNIRYTVFAMTIELFPQL